MISSRLASKDDGTAAEQEVLTTTFGDCIDGKHADELLSQWNANGTRKVSESHAASVPAARGARDAIASAVRVRFLVLQAEGAAGMGNGDHMRNWPPSDIAYRDE